MVENEDIKSKINFRDIKSLYIIKKIFSFLKKKHKLNMIIYNKELQNIFLVDIDDYKVISSKYKIGGKNGKGREYIINTNKLIFEGEYLDRKKNGKGKEYDYNGKIQFEGNFENGERIGRASCRERV